MQSASVVLMSNGDTVGAARTWPGGRGLFSVWGDFDGSGGGSVTLEWLGPDGLTWIQANDTTNTPIEITADGGALFELPAGNIRAVAVLVTPVRAVAARVPE